jgi:hypothetical protein
MILTLILYFLRLSIFGINNDLGGDNQDSKHVSEALFDRISLVHFVMILNQQLVTLNLIVRVLQLVSLCNIIKEVRDGIFWLGRYHKVKLFVYLLLRE